MDIRFGLISSDSHAQLDRYAFTGRMSKAKWGDRIPQVIEVEDQGELVECWSVDGEIRRGAVVNCPAALPDKRAVPRRWDAVPPKVYQPAERLNALDADGVDGEVLFPNGPVQNLRFGVADADLDLACVQAYNDALGAWTEASDRFVPLAMLPYLSPIETVVAQVQRAMERGHRGVGMLADPAIIPGVPCLADPYWNPLWALCQEVAIPITWHAGSGTTLYVPHWSKYSRRQWHTVFTGRIPASVAQMVPFLLFSGILDRYPRLKWALAESAVGWMAYVLESCDHEWERRHLWTEGLPTPPSETFRRQIYTSFWFEQSGIELRDYIGVDNIMWESDYPHITSTYPHSWQHVEETTGGLPDGERRKLLYANALRLYNLESGPDARGIA